MNAGVPVFLSVDGGEPVDAGSALMIMTLGAGNGAQVIVASEDDASLRPWRRSSSKTSTPELFDAARPGDRSELRVARSLCREKKAELGWPTRP